MYKGAYIRGGLIFGGLRYACLEKLVSKVHVYCIHCNALSNRIRFRNWVQLN